MAKTSRRDFLGTSALMAGGVLLSQATPAKAAANERVAIGVIGCGGRTRGLAPAFAGLGETEVVSVCDPDEARAAAMRDSLGGKPTIASDLRQLLDNKSIDAVVIATPDHWHAPAAILACDAGKHVYVEKPCSHNLREGRLLVDAARRNKRLVQHGTQSRSHDLVAQAIDILHAGTIGTVLVAKAWDVQRRGPIGKAEPSAPPAGFDYDMWLGMAPHVPFQRNRHHYTWHWWYDFGTGDMGNDGVHELDIARWGLGVEEHPTRIAALGGKYAYDDDQQFPDTQHVAFEYDVDGSKRQLTFEMRLWSRYGLEHGIDNGNAFYGTKGWMLLSKRGILKLFDEQNKELPITASRPELPNHYQNFIDAIRNGTPLRAEVEVGHRSAALCHLGNIATRVGRVLNFDPETETFADDAEATSLLSREYRNGHFAVPKGV